jgi:DNA-binding NarL/FixJ family response regulator
MHSHDRYINELFSLGASGYLLKDASGSDVVKAIHAALNGGTYLSPSISRLVIEDYVSLKRKYSREDLYSKLSDREREVLQLIAEGHSTREISEILCISSSTVKITNSLQLIQFAIRLGIVDIQP